MKKILTLTTIFSLVFTFSISLPALANGTVPAANPTLGDACGMDIALLLDMTGSIGSEVGTVRSAAKDFVDAFLPATPTLIGLVEFSDGTATEVQDLTADENDLKQDIDGLSAFGATNWEAALLLGTAMLNGGLDRDDSEHPDLILIITDGDPNEPGTDAQALEAAIVAANAAKTSTDPIRIVAIGVAGPDVNNLIAISGPIVSDGSDVTKDTDVITGGFGDLATILGDLANELCEDPPDDCYTCPDRGNDIVINDNAGVAINVVSAEANTGGNFADGSHAGDGGDGGDMTNDGDDIRRSSTGRGGNGGSSMDGGIVTTGNATAEAGAINVVNTNYTDIDRCACQDECCGEGCCYERPPRDGGLSAQDVESQSLLGPGNHDIVYNRNRAIAFNAVSARANTGGNAAMGSYAGDGGEGGDMDNEEGCDPDIEGSSTGAGGTGGDSGMGGDVLTGHSNARALGVNVLNTNVTRIRR